MFDGIEKDEFIKAVYLSLDYDDLLGRIGIGMNTFSKFYHYFKDNPNEINKDIKNKLELLNKGKPIESNHKYMHSLYYKYIKDAMHRLNSDSCYDVELLEEIKNSEAFKIYQISDTEIILLAKSLGFKITTVEELEDKLRIEFIKGLNIKGKIEKSKLISKTNLQALFNIEIGHLLYLAKLAGIEVV